MKKRIIAIDVLRGFALLGILLMNMSSFAMPHMAYFNPTVYGGDDVWNRLMFSLSHIFADQKMMALFSMLFGASVMLVTGNSEKRGKSPLVFHYVRNFWLLIIGLLHSILIWDGDILFIYAACSFVLYWLRRLSPKWQLALGLFIFFIPSLTSLGLNWLYPQLTPTDWVAAESFWQPDETAVSSELVLYRGRYAEQVAHRAEQNQTSAATTFGENLIGSNLMIEFFARALGMMLIGMAFYSWGILTGQRSDTFYIKMAQIGFGLGLPMALIGLYQYEAHDWGAVYSLFNGRIPNHIATPFIASGYIALIMLWSRSKAFTKLRDKLAATGRMALTNYIGQSIIGTYIFYGFGLGLFGYLNRLQQFGLILLVWTFQTLFSSWWLGHFQYGPLEWVWRMLSHRRWQPIQKKQAAHALGD